MRSPGESRRIIASVISVGAVVLLVVGSLVLFRTPRQIPNPHTALAAEYPRAELQLRDGRLYHNTDTNAFTGWMIEHYPHGSSRSRSAVFNGLLHGLSEGWHTNGNLQITEHFKAGVSHGLRTKWSSDGVRLSEANILEGRFQGMFRKWHQNGMLSEQVEFVDNQPDGIALAYFPSGSVKSRATLQNGKVIEQKLYEDDESKLVDSRSNVRDSAQLGSASEP